MITFEVFEALSKKNAGAFPYDMARTMQAPAYTLMTRGVKIDMNARAETVHDLRKEKDRYESIFSRLTLEGLDYAINYRSPIQLQKLFYDLLGLPVIKIYDKLTKDHKVSTNRATLEKLTKHPSAKPFCDLILAMRDNDKKIQVLETGLDNGRMHCSYQVAGPMTGRWASNTSVFGSGTNLQNISDKMRRVFIPDDGLKFAQFDLAQAESRVVAHLSLPFGHAYLDACNSGDLHTTVTKLVWPALPWGSAPDKEIAKRVFYRDFTYRDMSKRGGHASNYVGTPATISMHLKIPKTQAQDFHDDYFRAFPELRKWHNAVRVSLSTTRSISTPLGRVCAFTGRPWDSDTIKSAVAYAPQSTIGDILNLGFLKVWRMFDKIHSPDNPLELLTQVHDSILIQYHPRDESWLLPAVAEALTVPVDINGKECIIGVDIQTGWNWGKYIEKKDSAGNVVVENVHGLKDYKGYDEREPPKKTSILDRRVC
jgi:DNA polymerase-1